MFRAKPAAVALVAFVVVTIAWQALAIWTPPDPRRFLPTTWSASPVGFRAAYTLVRQLGLDAERSIEPPAHLFHGDRRVVLLEPEMREIEREKAALEDMAAWVRSGGELVVVTPAIKANWNRAQGERSSEDDREEPEILRILKRHDFVRLFELEDLFVAGRDAEDIDEEVYWNVFSTFRQVRRTAIPAERPFPVVKSAGLLEFVAEDLDQINLAARGARFFRGAGASHADGSLSVGDGTSDPIPVALAFRRGAGVLTLVSEPLLFTNRGLGEGDNAVAAARLIAGDGKRPIVFGEYYNGGMPIGQPIALAGVYPYGVILAGLLAAAALWTWRQAIRFGPPLPDPPPSRRSIGEYVDAMARLFSRGRKHGFVLRTCRDGLFETLRHELHLPHGVPESIIMRRLAQHDPYCAHRLATVIQEVDATLAAPREPDIRMIVNLQERLEKCRIHPNPPTA